MVPTDATRARTIRNSVRKDEGGAVTTEEVARLKQQIITLRKEIGTRKVASDDWRSVVGA